MLQLSCTHRLPGGFSYYSTCLANQWNTIEIDLDAFGGLAADRDDLFQLIIFGDPVGVADVYIDNIYFSKEQTVLSVNDVEFTE